MKPTLKQAKTAATRLHSLIVRHRNPRCQASATGVLTTPCRGPVQCAHIIPKRGTTPIRCDPFNGWGLCAAHHRVIDTRPDYWLDLVRRTVGLAEVDVWREYTAACVEDGLEWGGEHVTPLMFWRLTLDDLLDVAAVERVPLDTLPVWVKDRARGTDFLLAEGAVGGTEPAEDVIRRLR